MMIFSRLTDQKGSDLNIGYDFKSPFDELLKNKIVDAFIFSTQLGFSPLGQAMDMICNNLKVDYDKVQEIADWNRFENKERSLIGIKCKNLNSALKGVVLAPCENSKCYRPYYGGFGRDNEPNRDFYYNATFESIKYAVENFGARKIAITHLSASGNYCGDIATCTMEALAHFNDMYPKQLDVFYFTGCCIEERHLAAAQRLKYETHTVHRNIPTSKSQYLGFELLNF